MQRATRRASTGPSTATRPGLGAAGRDRSGWSACWREGGLEYVLECVPACVLECPWHLHARSLAIEQLADDHGRLLLISYRTIRLRLGDKAPCQLVEVGGLVVSTTGAHVRRDGATQVVVRFREEPSQLPRR